MLSRDDLELTRRDTAILALAELLDDNAAAGVIRQAVPHLGVRSVSGVYLRYKPATSLLAAYLADTPAGPQHVHVTAYRRDAIDKLGKHRRRSPQIAEGNAAADEPVVDADRALVVWPFPADAEIAALSEVAALGDGAGLAQRLRLDEHLGRGVTWQTARYKPQRRFVAIGRNDAGPCGVLRLYGAANYRRARRAAKTIHGLGDDALPRVLARSDRHATLVMSWQPGVTLAELLSSADHAAAASAFAQAGRVLARLHRQIGGKLPVRDVGVEAAALRRSAADLGPLCPDLRDAARRVAESCVELLSVDSPPVAMLHGDLHLGQIVVDAGGARLIDLDAAALGEAALDLGNLHAHLQRDAAGAGGNWATDELWTALLDGYAENAAVPPADRLAAWTAAAWLRLAHEPFRCRQSDWQAATAAMLDRALKCLDEDVRLSSGAARPATRSTPAPAGVVALRKFAEDQSLRFAAEALNAAEAEVHVSPLVRELLRDDSWQLAEVRLARHKPARRCLIEYRYRNARGNEAAVFGKIHVKPRHQRSWALQQELQTEGFAGDAADGISVPAAVGVVPQWRMWLQQGVDGVDGWQALAGPRALQVARQVGDAVVKLQQSGLQPRRAHALADELAILAERYERLGRERPDWRPRLAALLAGCRRLAARLPDAPLAPAHRDFYPDQVRVARERMWVLDHDLFCLADIHLDVGNFVGHFHELAIRDQRRRASLLAASESIVERFLQRQPAATRDGVEICTTLTLARHVSISTQFPARRYATEKIIVECERRIAAYSYAAIPVDLAI